MVSDSATRKPVTLDDVRHLGTIPVHHPTKPNAADLLGIGRALAYGMAQRGELPTLRLGAASWSLCRRCSRCCSARHPT